jgi:hypothetical protein
VLKTGLFGIEKIDRGIYRDGIYITTRTASFRLISCDDIVPKMKKKHIFFCVGLMKNFKISHNVRNTRENFKRGHSDIEIYKLTTSQSSLNLSYNDFFVCAARAMSVISNFKIET